MSSALALPPSGLQLPSICHVPDYSSSIGEEVVDFAASYGLVSDPWQAFVVRHALGERAGKWAAFEVGVEVARQNGKGGILEVRQLAGLFLLGEMLQIHSAHQFDTSLEAFRRLLSIIEAHDDLSRRVKRVSRAHGEEGIELLSRQRIRFRTRTAGGGRGFSGQVLYLDEAMILPEKAHGALLPTLSAQANPQVWYLGSAVDQAIHEHGLVFSRVRARAVRGDDPALAYFGWGLPYSDPSQVPDEVAADPESWGAANPALGIRISSEHIAREQRSMDPRTFAVERLGVGDWPALDAVDGQAIDPEAWTHLADPGSSVIDPVCFAFDVRPDRSYAAISVAGRRSDGLAHVEVIDHRPGTGWVADRLVELTGKHRHGGVVYDQASPAAALVTQIENLGVKIEPLGAKEHAQACGVLFDAVEQKTVRHLGTPELTAAVRGAVKRPLGDAWAWSRKSSAVDISPLVACTLALWKAGGARKSAYEDQGLVIA